VILDDIPLETPDMLRHYKQILGCQLNFSVSDKYLKKEHIFNWGKPCIYLSNKDPRVYAGVDVEWLDGNCEFVEIKAALFQKREQSPLGLMALEEDIDVMIGSMENEEEDSF
jgi:hypothetical protein